MNLGDDAFDDRRRGHDRLIVDALARHGGELVKHAGDIPHGVMNQHRRARALVTRSGRGDRELARALATEALERATEIGLAPDVRFAQAVLDSMR